MLSAAKRFVFDAFGQPSDDTDTCGVLPLGLPASLMRENLHTIWGETFMQYLVSPKADGTRRVLGFFQSQHGRVVFAMDRAGQAKMVTGMSAVSDAAYAGTLLDCEFVNVRDVLQVWVFDALRINGHCVRRIPYLHRLQAASDFVTRCMGTDIFPWAVPAHQSIQPMGKWVRHAGTMFFTCKPVWPHTRPREAYAWGRAMFPTDGLVFTPHTRAVSSYRSLNVFKWKPAAKHTIDFTVEVDGGGGRMQLLVVDARGAMVPFADVPVLCDNGAVVLVSGQVYECRWVAERQTWSVERPRPDKDRPNAKLTAERTCQNIAENVTLRELDPREPERVSG